MRRRHCLLSAFCPLALWIRKVLLRLSDRVSNIDLNSLTRLIPDGSTFSPQPLNSPIHCIIPAACSQSSWKSARPAHRVAPCPNKLNRRNGRQELKKIKRRRKGPVSRQFNYPTQLFEALRNSRLDLVSLIPTCHKHVPDLRRLTWGGRTEWRERRGADSVPGLSQRGTWPFLTVLPFWLNSSLLYYIYWRNYCDITLHSYQYSSIFLLSKLKISLGRQN